MKQPGEEQRLGQMMRDRGYVPVLDITPVVTTEYLEDKGTFKYEIAVYGTKARDAHKWEGWLGGRLIKRAPSQKVTDQQFEEVVSGLK